MLGLGTDIIEIERVAAAMQRERFVQHVFTENERAWLETQGHKVQSAAGLWCAKEAVAKALGTGFQNGLNLIDIEIGHTELGAPIVCRPAGNFLLSITHCRQYAAATAVLLEQEHSHADD